LKERGREGPFAEGGEGAHGIVPHDDDSTGEVEFPSCGLQGEGPGMGLPADLVLHVVRVRERADHDLALAVVPPTEQEAPSVEGRVPGDHGDAGRAGFASEEGGVERAGDQGPETATREGEVLKDAPDEGGGLVRNRGDVDRPIAIGLGLSSQDRGEEGHEREDVRKAARVVLDAAPQGGEVVSGGSGGSKEGLQAGSEAELLLGRDR